MYTEIVRQLCIPGWSALWGLLHRDGNLEEKTSWGECVEESGMGGGIVHRHMCSNTHTYMFIYAYISHSHEAIVLYCRVHRNDLWGTVGLRLEDRIPNPQNPGSNPPAAGLKLG